MALLTIMLGTNDLHFEFITKPVIREKGADRRDLETAEKYFAQALEIRVEVLGEDHPQTHFSRNNLGFLYYRQGRYADAEALLRENLALTEAAVARGLQWLSTQQKEDGGWPLKSGRSDAARSLRYARQWLHSARRPPGALRHPLEPR